MIKQQAENGGKKCTGKKTRKQSCNTNGCPGMSFLTEYLSYGNSLCEYVTGVDGMTRKRAQKVLSSTFSELPMGAMDRMGNLHSDMRWWN